MVCYGAVCVWWSVVSVVVIMVSTALLPILSSWLEGEIFQHDMQQQMFKHECGGFHSYMRCAAS